MAQNCSELLTELSFCTKYSAVREGESTCCLADTLQLHGVVPVLHAVHAGVAADAVKAGWLLVMLVVVVMVSLPD